MPRSPRIPLLGALACFLGLVATGVLALLLAPVQAKDSATLQGFTELNRPRLTPLLDQLAHLADPLPYAIIGFSLAGLALLRRRPRTAAAIVGLLVLTGLTSQTLKPLLASPRYDAWLGAGQISAASWPSGHATASMTLGLCAVLAVPAFLRPTAAIVGALFAIGVSSSILALGWHFPSDVLGGFLVAGTWTFLAVAALVAFEARHPSPAVGERGPRRLEALAPAALATAAVTAVVALVLARPEAAATFAADYSTSVAGAGMIAALAAGVSLGLARSA